MANSQNTVTGLLFIVFRWSICAYHVSNILKSLLWNFYLTKVRLIKMASFVTRLRIIVLCYSYSAYHQNNTLVLLPWNCHLIPLWRERWPISKILPQLTNLNERFPLVILCWSSERHFGAVSVKFSLNLITKQKMANLRKHCQTPHNDASYLFFLAYHPSVTLEPLS